MITGANDKLAYHEHATKMGAGAEAHLGMAEGALRAGPSQRALARIHAAARRASDLQPLHPGPANALGLALEARGNPAGAAKAFAAAAALAISLNQPPAGEMSAMVVFASQHHSIPITRPHS